MKFEMRVWVEVLAQAWSALRDNRLRSILSVTGIAVGVTAVIAVGTIAETGSERVFQELQTFGLNSVWVYRRYSDTDPFRAERPGSGIQQRDYQALLDGCCDKVLRATPYVEKEGPRLGLRSGNRYSNERISGVGVHYLDINNDVLVRGRPFRAEDERRRRPVVIIGPEVRDQLFAEGQDPIGQEIRISGRKFTVIGLLQAKSRDFLATIGSAGGSNANNRVLVPYTVLQQMIGSQDIRLIQAEATTGQDGDAAVDQIVSMLKRNHNNDYEYNSETMAQVIATANQILQSVSLIGIVAASISLLVGGLGIMNIMSTSVLERTREIGVRMAIGARRRDILRQFLFEAALIGVMGGGLGLALGGLIAWLSPLFTGISVSVSPELVALALLVSISVGLVSGYSPARRASSLQPVVALRYE